MKRNAITERKPAPVFLNYGGAGKFISEMNHEELEIARQSVLRRAREKAFSKGLPVYLSRNGELIAKYPDGSVVIVAGK